MPQDPVPVYDPRPENFAGSRAAPGSGSAISTEVASLPPLRPITTEPPGEEPLIIE